MRNFIFYLIFILLLPVHGISQEVITGRIIKFDDHENLIYLEPYNCRKNCMEVIIVKTREKGFLKDQTVRISGTYSGKDIFDADSIIEYNSSDPTGVRSRLKMHRGGRHHNHRMNHD
ncbi:MAG: hypothetical protein RBR08_11160 [Desulforegulaceae bacterium]|nr:hypothetical protein [Desulforegulaceae bacterium]